jgi:hypothetical protein
MNFLKIFRFNTFLLFCSFLFLQFTLGSNLSTFAQNSVFSSEPNQAKSQSSLTSSSYQDSSIISSISSNQLLSSVSSPKQVVEIPSQKLTGEVINTKNNGFIANIDGKTLEFNNIFDTIKITRDSEKIPISDLKPGDKVVVTQLNNGQVVSVEATEQKNQKNLFDSNNDYLKFVIPALILLILLLGLLAFLFNKNKQGKIKTINTNL